MFIYSVVESYRIVVLLFLHSFIMHVVVVVVVVVVVRITLA